MYFIGKEDTQQLRILAKPLISSTTPIEANSALARLIFDPDTTSKDENRLHK
jgi:hypothetical protein